MFVLSFNHSDLGYSVKIIPCSLFERLNVNYSGSECTNIQANIMKLVGKENSIARTSLQTSDKNITLSDFSGHSLAGNWEPTSFWPY